VWDVVTVVAVVTVVVVLTVVVTAVEKATRTGGDATP
jgi:hypothetical protein